MSIVKDFNFLKTIQNNLNKDDNELIYNTYGSN